MILPDKIFFTGAPGSTWSGIAADIEEHAGFNTTDRCDAREYNHHSFAGHRGAYFGPGMEFEADWNVADEPFADPAAGCKLIKSHHWAYQLDELQAACPDDWIMLVFRSEMASYAWWHQVGGFDIKYPSYEWYKNSGNMLASIQEENKRIFAFAAKHNLTWHNYTTQWLTDTFGENLTATREDNDVLVALYKP